MARSAETVAVICTESITVPRNETRWLGNSILLAKLILSPRKSKWLRRRVLCDVETASDWAKMSQSSRKLSMRIHICRRREGCRIHSSRKSAGSQGQTKWEDLVLIWHPFDCESQESSVMGGYLDMKVCVFQIQ